MAARSPARRSYVWLPVLILMMTIVATVAGGVALFLIESHLVASTGESLALTASEISDKLDGFLGERYGDVQMMGRAFKSRYADRRELTDYLEFMRKAYPVYQWIGVLDPQGRIVAATNPASVGQTRDRAEWFRAVRNEKMPRVDDAALYEEAGGVEALAFSAPIFNGQGTFVGVVSSRVGLPALEMMLTRSIRALQKQRPGLEAVEYQFLSRSGETLIDSMQPQGGRVNLKSMGLPSALRLETHQAGFVEELHRRRHVPVITGYARTRGFAGLEGLQWGVLVRMDRDDVLAPIRAVLWKLGVSGALVWGPLFVLLLWATSSVRREYGQAQQESARVRAAEATLRESEMRLQLILHHANDAIFQLDRNGLIQWASRQATVLTGRPSEELVNRPFQMLLAPSSRALAEERLAQARTDTNVSALVEYELVRSDGRVLWVEANTTNVEEQGQVIGRLVVARDITDRRQVEEQVREMAFQDALTGLPNRRLFLDRLNLAISQARRKQQLLAVLLLDLDQFKVVNDSLGHATGDLLLQRVAERLKACIRSGDTVARLGGDEFTILLPELSAVDDVPRIAQKLVDAFGQSFQLEGQEFAITTSLGISLYPADGTDGETLLKNADSAMYRAKEQGGNTHQFCTPAMRARASERLTLERGLRKALERDEFVVYYQPQVSLRDGRIFGVETLIRWRHPDKGLIPPAAFIPVAEETGLIVRLGQWVLQSACAQAKSWRDRGYPPLRVAVNLSARQFRQQDLVPQVLDILTQTGLAPTWLDLEITESLAMYNVEATITALRAFAGSGIEISMDDFGTGHSSLGYLKQFPLDTLKIDRTFVSGIDRSGQDAAIVKAILTMAHGLNIKVIAEGVETDKQLTFLRQHGCEGIQGYLFSPAVPAEVLEGYLVADRRLEIGVTALGSTE